MAPHWSPSENIVATWLNFLQVGEYSTSFLDNGYDDLETVKQIRLEDLRAIGVDNQEDEEVILLSVKILREQGAAWVYLLPEEPDMMSSTSDPSSSSPASSWRGEVGEVDTFRERLKRTQSSEETIQPLSLCDDIYCDISEEITYQQDSVWTDFWRKIFLKKKKSKLKKDATFERLKSILSPDGKTVISKISSSNSETGRGSVLSSLVRPLHYRTMKLSTPLITRREGGRITAGMEIEL